VPWQGSASYARLAALARGLVAGLRDTLDAGHPLVLVSDGDIGGLLGMQARSEEHVPGAIVSIDGIRLAEFDFIDIGDVIRATGAAPVVIKSLLFPSE
jgi:ethanolamine utilization protein EutA